MPLTLTIKSIEFKKKRLKKGDLGNFLPRARCENKFLCDFQTRLIKLLFFFSFFCDPHHAPTHLFKQTRSSSTTSSPSACRRRTTATTPPSTSWPHLRRYVSDSERPTATAAVTFIRIKQVSDSWRLWRLGLLSNNKFLSKTLYLYLHHFGNDDNRH